MEPTELRQLEAAYTAAKRSGDPRTAADLASAIKATRTAAKARAEASSAQDRAETFERERQGERRTIENGPVKQSPLLATASDVARYRDRADQQSAKLAARRKKLGQRSREPLARLLDGPATAISMTVVFASKLLADRRLRKAKKSYTVRQQREAMAQDPVGALKQRRAALRAFDEDTRRQQANIQQRAERSSRRADRADAKRDALLGAASVQRLMRATASAKSRPDTERRDVWDDPDQIRPPKTAEELRGQGGRVAGYTRKTATGRTVNVRGYKRENR